MTRPHACIVGNGGWGTALGLLLRGNGCDVTLWGPFEEDLSETRRAGENRPFLPGVPLPADLRWTSDPAEAARDADLVVLEGMGRGIETNLEARFTCDCLRIGMVKMELVARRMRGALYDLVCRFTAAPGDRQNRGS